MLCGKSREEGKEEADPVGEYLLCWEKEKKKINSEVVSMGIQFLITFQFVDVIDILVRPLTSDDGFLVLPYPLNPEQLCSESNSPSI